jgi:hypothetical protein
VSKNLREVLIFAILGAAIVAGWFLINGMSEDQFWWPQEFSQNVRFRHTVMKQALFGGLIGGAIGAIAAIARNVLKRDK